MGLFSKLFGKKSSLPKKGQSTESDVPYIEKKPEEITEKPKLKEQKKAVTPAVTDDVKRKAEKEAEKIKKNLQEELKKEVSDKEVSEKKISERKTQKKSADTDASSYSNSELQAAFQKASAEAEAAIAKSGRAAGKYEFYLGEDGYHFSLSANNGQILFDSPSFTTLLGALTGVKSFQKAVESTDFDIKKDKYARFRFILANRYYGENYDSKDQCQKSVESVKNFANNSHICFFCPDEKAFADFELAKKKWRLPSDVDWITVAKKEAETPKFGKFEISPENGEFCFYLLANNGQILYSSRYYSTEAACRNGIDSFKRAVYIGNFFVDPDKFGTYRYVLKNVGSAPAFIGESYDNRQQCEKVIESVKNFVVSASIEKVEE